MFAADRPRAQVHMPPLRRHIFVGFPAAGLALVLQRLSPALTDRLLTVADQIFVRQQRDDPDRGRSNLYEPRPGCGATTGTSVRLVLRRPTGHAWSAFTLALPGPWWAWRPSARLACASAVRTLAMDSHYRGPARQER